MKASLWLVLATALRSTWGAKVTDNAVTRVVGLLTDLQTRIEKDGVTEQATYDKYACWCEQTSAKTAGTITAVKDLLKTTGNSILKLKGSVAMLSSEIKGLAVDIKTNQEQQAQHTNVREKENTAYMAEKVELEAAIGSLGKAVDVLKAATGASFVQTTAWTNAVSDVVSAMSQASTSVKLSDKQLSMLSQLSGKGSSSYAPQSATIQGILADMYSTFSQNLQTSTADEATAHRNYEDLMGTLQSQLTTLEETLVKKEQQKTEDDVQLADATQTYADKEEELTAEISLFDATKTSCTEKTSDWSARSSARTSELAGISKALEILSSDEAKDLFAKSVKKAASFIQLHSQAVSPAAAKNAVKALQAHAKQSHSFRLAALAAEVRMQTTGHFDAVIVTIDKLLAQLVKEEAADVKKVDECKEQYQTITLTKNDLDWKIENNKAKVQKHEKAITETTAAKEVTITSIADADTKLTDIEKTRTAENDAYIAAKADDEKAIGLLKDAKAALAEYYATALLQQEPDSRLSNKNSAKGQTDGVIALLDNIIEDLVNELAEGKAAEEAAQLDYEVLKKAVEEQKAKLEKTKINQESAIADEENDKKDESDLQTSNEASLTTETTTETDLKKTCDDAIKLQPERAKKRGVESDGLKQAKEFLAGMESSAFVQAPKPEFPTFQTLSFLQRRGF